MGSKGSKSKGTPKAATAAQAAAKADGKRTSKEKGAAVTRVQKDLEQSMASSVAPPAAPAAGAGASKAVFKGRAWEVDGASGADGEQVVDVAKVSHGVACYSCKEDAVIKVQGKCASVALDGCKKTELHVQDVVGSIEVSNCARVKIFVTGTAPSISVDKSDGVQIEISEECAASPDFMVTAASSSEMNLSCPHNGELVEMALPEQFVHKIDAGKVQTNPSDLYSG